LIGTGSCCHSISFIKGLQTLIRTMVRSAAPSRKRSCAALDYLRSSTLRMIPPTPVAAPWNGSMALG
jgi:hypothetical protein